MHRPRNSALLVATPVAAYLALLLLVAALVRPPLIGWLGLGVVAIVGVALTTGAVILFPRMRTNVTAVPGTGPGLLVVAEATCTSSALRDVVRRHVGDRALPVHVVAPVLAPPLHYLSTDEERERSAAEARLEATLTELRAAGIPAGGEVGADDPVQAIGDALAVFPATELVLVTGSPSHWLDGDLLDRVRGLVPAVEQVAVEERTAGVGGEISTRVPTGG
jgi:hypothetical protein